MNEGIPETRFTQEDARSGDEARRAARRALADRSATTVVVLAAGLWIGGLVALGACAAPFVFRLTPRPFSGDAMGAAFARFDQVAIGCSAAILAAEMVRTFVGRAHRGLAARARRLIAVVMAMAAAYGGLILTPKILALHRAGALRGFGPEGEELDRIHRLAEAVGKAQVGLGILLVALHVFTLQTIRTDNHDDAHAPLPPADGAQTL